MKMRGRNRYTQFNQSQNDLLRFFFAYVESWSERV